MALEHGVRDKAVLHAVLVAEGRHQYTTAKRIHDAVRTATPNWIHAVELEFPKQKQTVSQNHFEQATGEHGSEFDVCLSGRGGVRDLRWSRRKPRLIGDKRGPSGDCVVSRFRDSYPLQW